MSRFGRTIRRRAGAGAASASAEPPPDRIVPGLATLVAGNAVAAAIGFAQNVVVVRALGVADYGVYGVLASAAAICTNALDLRLGDATMRRFYGAGPGMRRAGDPLAVLVAGALAQAAIAVVLGAAVAAAVLAVRGAFPGTALGGAVLLAFAASEALTYAGRYVVFSLRFAERPRSLAVCEVLAVGVRAAAVVVAVTVAPTLAGLVAGLAAGGLASVAVGAAGFVHVWVVRADLRTTPAAVRRELRVLAARRRELFALGTTNYQNLLHRGADVLVLGLVAGEREAGLYKLARSATDALYLLYDAAAKTVQPLFMRLVAEGAPARLRTLARRAVAAAVLGVGAVLAAEAVLLEPLVAAVFGAAFVPATAAIALLTVPAVFVFGLQLWAWPLVVAAGEVRAYAATAFAAVVVGQYGLGLAGLLLDADAGATWFALGYVAAEVLLWAAFGARVAGLLRGLEPSALPARAAGGAA